MSGNKQNKTKQKRDTFNIVLYHLFKIQILSYCFLFILGPQSTRQPQKQDTLNIPYEVRPHLTAEQIRPPTDQIHVGEIERNMAVLKEENEFLKKYGNKYRRKINIIYILQI
jgi:hypothetical protein